MKLLKIVDSWSKSFFFVTRILLINCLSYIKEHYAGILKILDVNNPLGGLFLFLF